MIPVTGSHAARIMRATFKDRLTAHARIDAQ